MIMTKKTKKPTRKQLTESPDTLKQENLSEALRLFGFQIGKDNNKQINRTFAIPQVSDGAVTIQAGGIYGTYVDLEGVAKNEIELITRYREMSLQPECENAIDDVVNEAIVVEEQEAAVKLNLEKLKYSSELKNKIVTEFEEVLRLLNFNEEGHDIFKRWYVDGRLFYHIMIDETNPSDGIQEVRYIDPRRIRKVREIQKGLDTRDNTEIIKSVIEYYIYNERGINNASASAIQGVKIAVDAICQVNSGLVDATRNMVLSYLHKAIKPMNQLRMMEDALVIYRLSRAPERRIFYIDVGNLPKIKAEQYLKDIMNKYRNKIVYDSATGEVRDDKKFLSMMEDYWLPRREGTKGTEISTLPGGDNLGEITDVTFFQEKLYRALGVPVSRLKSEGGFNLGRSSEISRDEVKFSKFVSRIRNKFKQLFDTLLKTQLILKGIISKDEWEEIREGIFYDFLKDSYYAELKNIEILNARLEAMSVLEPLVGVYYSRDYARRKILKQTDEEIKEMDEQIKKEKVLIPDNLEAQVQAQKKIMDFQTGEQTEIMGKQAVIQKDQQAQQAQLANDQAGSQIAVMSAQAKLEKTKMAHTQVKAALAAKQPKKPAAKAKR